MPKITNWDKLEEGRWMNESTDDEAHIVKDTTRGQFGEETHYYPALNGEIIRADWAETSRREAIDRLRNWMKQNPYAGQEERDADFTEQERQHLVETIMAVRGEENQSRPASDTVSEDRMQQFRRDIEELDDEALKDSWYQWDGEWLAQRDEYYDEVDQQFKKTLRGEHDYGFV